MPRTWEPTWIKIFPAEFFGPPYIKSLKAVFPTLNFMPTGGVTTKTVGEFLRAGAYATAAGSALVDPAALKARDWAALTARSRRVRRPPPPPQSQRPSRCPKPMHRPGVSSRASLTEAAYRHRRHLADEAADGARLCAEATRHGIRDAQRHRGPPPGPPVWLGLKGLRAGGGRSRRRPSRFEASLSWNATGSSGSRPPTRPWTRRCGSRTAMASERWAVENAFHYLGGGGYVIDAARRGYVAYTNCTAALAKVVPFGGKFPTLGTNPARGLFPTTEALGLPDRDRLGRLRDRHGTGAAAQARGLPLPPLAALDRAGNPTIDPHQRRLPPALGAHKGYGLALINEIVGAFIGGSLPTLRSRWEPDPRTSTPAPFSSR